MAHFVQGMQNVNLYIYLIFILDCCCPALDHLLVLIFPVDLPLSKGQKAQIFLGMLSYIPEISCQNRDLFLAKKQGPNFAIN